MNENEIVLDPGSDLVLDSPVGLSGDSSNDGQAADLTPGSESAQTVSSGDLNTGNVQASGSGLQTVPEVQTVQMVSSEDSVPDYSDALGHIDYLLTAILFVLVLDFSLKHIKSAVRLFVGRSHYE